MTILLLVQVLLLLLSYLFLTYLAVLTVLAGLVRLRRQFETSRTRRFAFVIPAHNEEETLGRTLQSLKEVSYPADMYRVIVVADNCTDNTASVARGMGALVYERDDPQLRSKGYALRWVFDRLLGEMPDLDAFVVIDADSTPSPDYLTVMNWYLEQGAPAVQSSDLVELPDPEAWNAQMTRIGFLLGNYVRPLGRKALGGTVGLRGNGMCFTRSILKAVPWESYSLAEDLEHGLRLLQRGYVVAFAPEANVYAIMPRDAKHAESQRSRWEGGRFPVIRRFGWPLALGALQKFSLVFLDAFLDLVTPALVNLTAFVFVSLILTAILAIAGVPGSVAFLVAWAGALALALFHLFAGLRIARADDSVYRSLRHIPKYAFWKLRLYARMVQNRGKSAWIRTTRER